MKRGIIRLARTLVRLDAQQVGENSPLLRSEGRIVTSRIQHDLALIDRHGAKILESMAHYGLAIGRKRSQAARRLPDLRTVFGRQALDRLGAGQAALALRLGHLIELVKLLDLALLLSRAEAVEARLLAEHPLLLAYRHVLVLGHPLRQMAGSLGIGTQRIRRSVIRRPGSTITGSRITGSSARRISLGRT
jgi:hypothetical protein